MKLFQFYICFMLFAFVMSPALSFAQTSFNGGGVNGGSIIPGNDIRACAPALEGAIKYNSVTKKLQFCDGTNWLNSGGSCTANPACPVIGNVCTDGSVFAGFNVYGTACSPIYVATTNQSTAIGWSTEDITTTTDFIDGKANQAWVVANRPIANYPAMQLCENLGLHTKTDWYLPSVNEMTTLFINRTAINASSSQNFATQDYWTSTGRGQYEAFGLSVGNSGIVSYVDDAVTSDVRCVRRD